MIIQNNNPPARRRFKGVTMSFSRKQLLSIFLLIGLVWVSTAVFAQTEEEQKLAEEVRKRIIRLSEFRAFDWISFNVEGTKVTLMGYASLPSLFKSAERTVSKIKGVTEVDNQIEILPNSPADDRIRMNAYTRIYTHPTLQRYAPGGGVTRSGFWDEAATVNHWGLDASMTVRGPHAVHIIVKHGHVVLIGQLASSMERQIAETVVQGLSGVFSVQNLIQIPE
jgi:hypothetical protein